MRPRGGVPLARWLGLTHRLSYWVRHARRASSPPAVGGVGYPVLCASLPFLALDTGLVSASPPSFQRRQQPKFSLPPCAEGSSLCRQIQKPLLEKGSWSICLGAGVGVCLLSLFRRCFPRRLLVLNSSSKLTRMLITTQPVPIRQQMCLSCQSSLRPQATPHLSWVGVGSGGCPQGERVGHPAGLQLPALNPHTSPPQPHHSQLEGTHRCPGFQHGLGAHLCLQVCRGRLVFVVVQSLSRVRLFATPLTAAHQVSLSFTISQSLLKLIAIELVMPSNHLTLCRPLPFLPSTFPSIRVFSNVRWPKYWSFSFGIIPMNI